MQPAFNTVALVNSVGQLVGSTTHSVTLRDDWTVEQAVDHLRGLSPHAGGGTASAVLDFYVLDADDKLVGTVSARRLLFDDPSVPLSQVMGKSLVTMKNTDSLLTACELFNKHRLLAIPVIDDEHKFLGALDVSVYTKEQVNMEERQATDEMFQLIGVHLDHAKNASALDGYKLRMPWLLANIGGGVMCAVLSSIFAPVQEKVIVLAMFVPVMLALSESVSIQSATLSIQGGKSRTLKKSLMRELSTSLFLGITSGLMVLLVALIWQRSLVPVIIGGSIVVNMLLSAAIGNLLPKLVSRLKLNPNIASGPLVLATSDMVSITLYLSLATAVLLHETK